MAELDNTFLNTSSPPVGSIGVLEEAYQGDFYVHYPYKKLIFNKQTRFQRVVCVDTLAFGRALFLDEILNSAESDEFIYHEALVHPAMLRAAERKAVLIVGGAEGGSLRETLRYPELEEVVMVDIDQELVELCREHFTDIYGNPWSDSRLELRYGDGRTFIENAFNEGRKFDVIILDLNEASEDSPAQKLFTKEFYGHTSRLLKPGGMIAVQSEWMHTDFHLDLTATHRNSFLGVMNLEVNIPSYLMPEAFNICTPYPNRLELSPGEIDRAIKSRNMELKFYNGGVDLKMRVLPPFMLERYEKPARVFTDQDLPVYVFEQ